MKDIIRFLQNKSKIRILIIRLKPIGDTVLISPVFRNLKKLYPQSRIEVIVYPFTYDAIKNNPYVDRVIVLKQNNFSIFLYYMKSLFKFHDVIIDYINNPTSTLISFFTHAKFRIGNISRRNFFYNVRYDSGEKAYSAIRCLKLLAPLGLNDFTDYLPELFLDEKDIKKAGEIFKDKGVKGDTVGLFVSAKYPTRQYSSKNFFELGKLITGKTKYRVLFIIGKGDKESLQKIKTLVGDNKKYSIVSEIEQKLTVGILGAIISKLKFLIINDTGPKHLANALKIPTLTIFTSTDERVWNPPDLKKFPVIKETLECFPCHRKNCPKNTLECTTNITPGKIFEEFKKAV